MNRQEKQAIIESLKTNFQTSQAAFVVGVRGITVAQTQTLRRGIRAEGGKMLVAKNTFACIATDGLECAKNLQPYFKSQVAVVFAFNDSSAVAKVLCNYAKENEKVTIVGGCLQNQVIDSAMIEFLESLPAKEIVVAQACGALKAPLVAHVSLLHQLIAQLLYVLKQASEKPQV